MSNKDVQAKKLISDINKKIATWNERSSFKLKGVGNLSMSDLDTLVLYARNQISFGNPEIGLLPLRGELRKVFEAYGLV